MDSLAGRDHALIGEALALAVAVDMSLPPELQAASNCDDMSDYICARYSPAQVATFAWKAHRKTGLPVTAFFEGEKQGSDAHAEFGNALAELVEAAA